MKTLKRLIFLCIFKLAVGQSSREPRIINGKDAYEGEFPYMVSIQNAKNNHKCGGSILNENYILTAAHCVDQTYYNHPYEYKIHVGLRQDKPDTMHNVEAIYIHEDYDPRFNQRNDIAVVKVNPPFVFNNIVSAVVLPAKDLVVPSGTKAIFSGWGFTEDSNTPDDHVSSTLQKITLTVRTNSECDLKLINSRIYKKMICTLETSNEERGPCSHDSGSPLVINKNVIIGVMILIYGDCGEIERPNVHTRVSEYIDWINQHMM